ncbi:ROK family protein [Kitasatospora sp. GAS1066B]|uniref:ROK family protein n=1 Tax=Kitasatospora sp. GAS1066B TaxID=3156271 RepID=UPI0035196116
MTVIALDVGGTRIKAGVMAPDGTVLHTEHRATRAEFGPDAVLEAVLGCATELSRVYAPRAAGLAVPGLVDEASGVAVFAANLGWRQVHLQRWLAKELGIPVAFGHDVRAGALAEARLGAGHGCRSFLFVPVGTGIAAAVMLDGRAMAGSHGFAGELGHLVVRPGGEPCPCGGRGCLEALASAAAIARRYQQATGAGEISGRCDITAEDVQHRAAAGDQHAARIWREAIEALADGLAAAITLLDPERIVIGGGLADAGQPYFGPLRAALAARLTFQRMPEIRPAALGHQAGCLGAALLAQDLRQPPGQGPAGGRDS